MDIQFARSVSLFVVLCVSQCQGVQCQTVLGNGPSVRFDMPAVVPAIDTGVSPSHREVTIAFPLSSLIVNDSSRGALVPPIDHLLIRCSMRDQYPVVGFLPKTELETDYAGPIAVTQKRETSDNVGLNVDSAYHPFGAGHLGADSSDKDSNSSQYSKHAPMQAVVASGTTDRGRGVYFKLRWTSQQVLEGEKVFQVSFAVPNGWRGGLVDVSVVAKTTSKSLFREDKLEDLTSQQFVVAVHQESDMKAAALAMRLADLDHKLAEMSRSDVGAATLADWIRQTFVPMADRKSHREGSAKWYRRVVDGDADPHMDKELAKLPMPVRVTVLDYADASRSLTQ
ncbi:hypothetical protein [Rhodopirellula sp. MGV]|uniref:hypothetical protein n=1 Tax=Rhodopirellula sp. MGV TaxID=2023130 RepID=UPI000B96F70C|nr:hypothetical protein [Rhodopirellula sp. MGV]OYP35975.1 hypothetical protein CGZ80_09445 [Rhodopirellula sp. MGV]PNY36668.1 hypothetical protein C2E31_12560 [Rhodopirellula baltica]